MFSSNYVWFITHRLFNHIQIHFFPEEGWYVSEIFILFTLLENQHPLASQSIFFNSLRIFFAHNHSKIMKDIRFTFSRRMVYRERLVFNCYHGY